MERCTGPLLENYLATYGWTYRSSGTHEWTTGFQGQDRSFPLRISLSDTWISFHIEPYLGLDIDWEAWPEIARCLLELNGRSSMVRLSLCDQGRIEMSLEVSLQVLRRSSFPNFTYFRNENERVNSRCKGNCVMGCVGGGSLGGFDISRLYIHLNSRFLIGTEVFYKDRTGYIANADASAVWVRFRDTNRMTRFSREFLESFDNSVEKPKIAKSNSASKVKKPADAKRRKARKPARSELLGKRVMARGRSGVVHQVTRERIWVLHDGERAASAYKERRDVKILKEVGG